MHKDHPARKGAYFAPGQPIPQGQGPAKAEAPPPPREEKSAAQVFLSHLTPQEMKDRRVEKLLTSANNEFWKKKDHSLTIVYKDIVAALKEEPDNTHALAMLHKLEMDGLLKPMFVTEFLEDLLSGEARDLALKAYQACRINWASQEALLADLKGRLIKR